MYKLDHLEVSIIVVAVREYIKNHPLRATTKDAEQMLEHVGLHQPFHYDGGEK